MGRCRARVWLLCSERASMFATACSNLFSPRHAHAWASACMPGNTRPEECASKGRPPLLSHARLPYFLGTELFKDLGERLGVEIGPDGRQSDHHVEGRVALGSDRVDLGASLHQLGDDLLEVRRGVCVEVCVEVEVREQSTIAAQGREGVEVERG